MKTKKENTLDTNKLFKEYNWYKNTFPEAVQKSGDEFLEPNFRFEMIAVSKNINMLMEKESYFVTKIRIDKLYDTFVRISDTAVNLILDKVLGRGNRRFDINKVTDLESKVLTAFNAYVYKMVSKLMAPSPVVAIKRRNFDMIHLTFIVKDEDENTMGKFIISLPDALLKPEQVVSTDDKFSDEDFFECPIKAKLLIGTTKFTVKDLKHLDIDDIVVFENSNIKKLKLIFQGYEQDFKIKPNLELVMQLDNDGGNDMTDNAPQNLWDSIEVEMCAEFDPVKITLGNLKNIEQGLVLDLASIYDNKVTLRVENKIVARGDLVIINDRYGVKISEILTQEAKPKQLFEGSDEENDEQPGQAAGDNAEEASAPAEGPVQQAPADEEDEFDYSDFELEDEDI